MRASTSMSLVAAAVACLLASPLPARAADPASPDAWKVSLDIYLWGASIGAETVTGGDVHVGFDTLLDHLDMAFMGGLGARKGKWTLAVDAIYMDVSGDSSRTLTLPDASVAASANLVLKAWVLNPNIGYNVVKTDSFTLDLVAGARYLYMKPTLSAQVDLPLETKFWQFSTTDNIWNGIGGIRGRVYLCPRLFVPFYADAGAGASKLTWQAFGGIGYSFRWIEVVAAYRYIDWNLKDNEVFKNMNLGGPLLGARIYF